MAEFVRERNSWWRQQFALLLSYRGLLGQPAWKDFHRILLFAGYPRSGHTLIGALLDAHPRIALAHEADSVAYLKRRLHRRRLFQLLLDNSARFARSGRNWSGYNYRVPGHWQGRHHDLLWIGDKSGGRTSRAHLATVRIHEFVDAFLAANLEPTFLHVIRNPYDVITTMAVRSATRRGKTLDTGDLERKIRHFARHAEGIRRLKRLNRYRVIDIYFEAFVADAQPALIELLGQLDLQGDQNYLAACMELVWAKPRSSRHTIELWTPELIECTRSRLAPYPWLAAYQFDAAP